MITVRTDYLQRDIDELRSNVREMRTVIDELRRIEWALQIHSAMDARVWEIRRIRDKLDSETQMTLQMLQALERVRESYNRSEMRILDNAEETVFPKPRTGISPQTISDILNKHIRIPKIINSSIRKM